MSAALDLRAANADHPNAPGYEDARLPANIEAEQALLGAVLYEGATVGLIGPYLTDAHFYEPVHGRIYALARSMADRSERPDPILIAERLKDDPALNELGGLRYLADLVNRSPPAANAPDYARVIFDTSIRRQLISVCAIGTKAAVEANDGSAFDITAELRRNLESIEADAAPEDSSIVEAPAAAATAVAAMQDRALNGRSRGLLTGLRCIDRRLNGLKPGALIVIGGRPAMGKTSLARAIAHGAAVRNPRKLFLFIGIEMGPEEMMQRELSAITHQVGDGIEHRAMSSGTLTPMDIMAIEEAQRHVPPNLILSDSPTLSVEDVRRKLWAMKRRGDLGAIFIDYLQLMRKPAAMGRNEASQIAEMTMALKQTARQSGICIVLLSQLSRALESRDDKRPTLADLRESGAIEQDADVVLFPYREHYYLAKNEPAASAVGKHQEWEMRCEETRRRMDVICAKQRGGPEGVDRQRYVAEFDYIEDDRDGN